MKRTVEPCLSAGHVPFSTSVPTGWPPFSKRIKYSFPPLNTVTSNQLLNALTTDAPTPCKPPDTL